VLSICGRSTPPADLSVTATRRWASIGTIGTCRCGRQSSANFWNVAGSLAEFTSPLASSSFHRPLRFRRQFHHPLRLFQVLVVFFLNLIMDNPFSDCESQVQTVEDAGQRVHHQLDHLRFLRLSSPPAGRLLGVQGPLVFRSNRYLIRNVIRSCIVCAF
jgi:hypothetical protein